LSAARAWARGASEYEVLEECTETWLAWCVVSRVWRYTWDGQVLGLDWGAGAVLLRGLAMRLKPRLTRDLLMMESAALEILRQG